MSAGRIFCSRTSANRRRSNTDAAKRAFVPEPTSSIGTRTSSTSTTRISERTRVQPNEEHDLINAKEWVITRSSVSPVDGVDFIATCRESLRTGRSTSITIPFDLLTPSDGGTLLHPALRSIHRIIVCQSHGAAITSKYDREARVKSFFRLFSSTSFTSLRSLVLPAEFRGNPSILEALKRHPTLMQLEITMPTTFSVDDAALEAITMAMALGLMDLHQVRILVIPDILATRQVVVALSKLESLVCLKVKSTRSTTTGGDRFAELITAYNISSAHCFYALRWLDVGIARMYPKNRSIVARRFPNITYL